MLLPVLAILACGSPGPIASNQPEQQAKPASPAGTFANPVLDRDFADPDVLNVGDRYFAFATNSRAENGTWHNVQAAISRDLGNWTALGDALPKLPSWARQQGGSVWAPDVSPRPDDAGYLLYLTARHQASDRQCIGVATGDSPGGPFTPHGTGPFVCQIDEDGSIDPASFVDEDGSRYLVWKSEGRRQLLGRGEAWIYLQALSSDGLALVGEPTRLIRADRDWEGPLVEAATLWKRDGRYYLFYSGHGYKGDRYAVGYAAASNPRGPYAKPPGGPLLATRRSGEGAVIGPGGQDIVAGRDGRTWIAYHAWDPSERYRRLNVDPLVWDGDTPRVVGPTLVPQPLPVPAI